MFYRIVRALLIPVFKLFYRIKVEGGENEPEGGYLACVNHTSYLDPIFTAFALKRTQRFIAKSSLTRFRFYRWIFKKVGVITVNRGSSDINAVKKAVEMLKKGETVCIFPQGTRTKTKPLPAQALAGAGLIACLTEATVLPVSIIQKNYRAEFLRRTRVVIGKPIPYAEYTTFKENPKKAEIAEYCFSFVCAPFEKEEKK